MLMERYHLMRAEQNGSEDSSSLLVLRLVKQIRVPVATDYMMLFRAWLLSMPVVEV